MSGHSTYEPSNPLLKWIERRLPIMGLMKAQAMDFPTPKNLNYWFTFGGILTFCLAAQIIVVTPRIFLFLQ